MKKLSIIFFAALCAVSAFGAQAENSRAQWMKGKYGLMVHWLFLNYDNGDTVKIDKLADDFDIDAFMKDFDATGAQWLILTVGQNTGAYCSPNAALEKYCGKGHSSSRDLALEIAKAVKARGKHFIAYIPCEVRGNASVRDGLAWTQDIQNDKAEFQKRYLEVIREWSLRFGKFCDGWWVDGAYGDIAPHLKWEEWHAALRAGNSDALITFNPGILRVGRPWHLHPNHDYLAGEVGLLVGGKIRINNDLDNPLLYMPPTAYYECTRTLYHALVPIDSFWAAYSNWEPTWKWMLLPRDWEFFNSSKLHKIRPPLYSPDDLFKFVRDFTKAGGGVTLNLGITENGGLSVESVEQVKSAGARLRDGAK